jgi:glutamyl-tRNA synthetase
VGYLPDAIINYLVLLGWSLDDKTEFFTRQQMIDNFSLERVTKSPASFDPKKLWSFQDHYMQALPIKQKVAGVLPYLQRAGLVTTPPPCDIGPTLKRILEAAGSRIKTLGDILDFADFFTPDEQLAYDEQAFDLRVRPAEALELLTQYRQQLATVESFEAEPLEKFTQEFIAGLGKKIGDIVHPLRVALTGKPVGLGLFDTLEILGRERSLSRIDLATRRAA